MSHTPYTYARQFLGNFGLFVKRDDTPRGYVADLKLLQVAVARMMDEEAWRLRDEGATWAEVGLVFGMTKQGAQKRFGA